jgi:hypothetical protein
MIEQEFRDLYKWVYYSSKFFSYSGGSTTLNKKDIEKFCELEGIKEPDKFQVINQGSILMMLYGLFVIPKEFWRNYLEEDSSKRCEADDLIFSEFAFVSRRTFNVSIPSNELLDVVFLRRFRNALAHSNVEIIKEENLFKFRNFNKQGQCNLEITNNAAGLGEFVDEISHFFIKHL